jgi:hypothetical protein
VFSGIGYEVVSGKGFQREMTEILFSGSASGEEFFEKISPLQKQKVRSISTVL